ncbi:DegT/DnrJ/EryC1/StrS aminotransferase family protein [Pseudoalteromonas sp. MMG012]|uniref:DegT/DnrJ/EryC1/StrS family aminotransferase n=1 Tax=Pseudoalteromonas sp. MMG012 TaxID=2822686 RepID=UPI001B3A0096|nr:DegT/DnrJ/EryC1/StrS family aminotransferase [Pseudoalteromonas sp. MMG012]MBQ4849021.1 DegT/DnrJ/EryC1/StrS family aminotransferase [Pseudoalteromonas sp. MMG012]
MTFVTSPYLPSIDKYIKYVESIYSRKLLTNNGPLVKELTKRLEEYLGVKNLLLTSSGTMALQIAFGVKKLQSKNVITTPFTFQATYSALAWQGTQVEFCDINTKTWNLDINILKSLLKQGKKIDCIVPVHTFGNPCDIEQLNNLKAQYDFEIIYDSAHALTTKNSKLESILNYGDINCFSLHATKLFHTIEGGGITFKDRHDFERATKMINFGLDGDDVSELGINGKLSEFHAAMGLAVLDDLSMIIEQRQARVKLYKALLGGNVQYQHQSNDFAVAPAYMPIVLESPNSVISIEKKLQEKNIFPRRYFYPCVHQTSWYKNNFPAVSLPNSEYISARVLCLPLSPVLDKNIIQIICNIILTELKKNS